MANELLIPDTAEGDPNAFEVLRVWVAKGGQHVSISTGVWEDPEAWGIVLADLAGHVANAYAQVAGLERQQTLDKIKDFFNRELDSPTHTPKGTVRNKRRSHRGRG